MDSNYSKKLIFAPALITFFVALLLIYKFSFPISWDVYYHIHMSDLYMNNGLVFWDYYTVAPYGRLIMYPPLFHLSLAFLSKITGISLIDLTEFLQPVFACFLIGSVSFCAYKLSSVKEGIITGFLGMFCFVTFNRSVICTPATVAIALSMICCVLFFTGFKKNNIKNIIISAVSLGLICNLHMASALLTMGVLGLYGVILLFKKQLNIKYVLLFIPVSACIGLPWWIYILMNYGLFFNSIPGNSLSLLTFIYKYYGIIPFIFTVAGFLFLYRDKSDKALFLFTWSLSLVLLSQVTYFGIKTVSIRILEVAAYPLILIGGIGLTGICGYLKNGRIKNIFLIAVVLSASVTSVMYVDSYTPDVLGDSDYNETLFSGDIHMIIDPVGTILKPAVISSRFGNARLAHDRYDVMKWFMENTNGSVVVSEDSIMDTIIVSTSNTPVVYGGFSESIPEYVVDPVHIVNNLSTKSELSDLNIGFLLLRENTPLPWYVQTVYSNSDYRICIIKI